jgi:short-subunit dehydrogenase
MSRFANEVFLITGAASGIGRELVRQLLLEGASIAGIDCQADGLQTLEAEINNSRFAWAVADVTDRAQLFTVVSQLQDRLGPVDRLIACAGVGLPTPCLEFSGELFESIIRVNLFGVANAVATVMPGMIERKKGHLVALSSLASFRGLPLMSAYSASKSGVNCLFDSLSLELREYGIRTTTICPGWIRTPMTAPLKGHMPRILDVDDAVRRILKAVWQQKRLVAFPWPDAMVMRLMRWLPPAVADRIVRLKKLPKVRQEMSTAE